jgi:hypothetical protein
MSGRNKYKLSLKEGFPNSSLKNPHEVPMNVSSQHKKKKKKKRSYFRISYRNTMNESTQVTNKTVSAKSSDLGLFRPNINNMRCNSKYTSVV